MRRLMHSSAIDRFDEERDVEGLSRTFAVHVATYVCLCPEVCVSLSTIECRNEFQTESIKHRNDVTRVTQSLSARISGIARSRHYLGTLAITLVCRNPGMSNATCHVEDFSTQRRYFHIVMRGRVPRTQRRARRVLKAA